MNSLPANKAPKFELPPSERIHREGSTREVIYFTKLRDTLIEESEFQKLTTGWTNWVNNKCVNQFGCTSDLLYYDNKQQALNEFSKTISGYSNEKKYELRLAHY